MEKKIVKQILSVVEGKPYEMHVIRDIIFIENDSKQRQRKSEDTKVTFMAYNNVFSSVNRFRSPSGSIT